jgi:uncharacterized delta-60 repeat protein
MLALILAGSGFLVRVEAADGDLDITFNTDGKLTTDFFGQSDLGNDLTAQSDGKIIVAGRVMTPDMDSDFGLARYDNNGAPDASFGAGGRVTTDFSGSMTVVWRWWCKTTARSSRREERLPTATSAQMTSHSPVTTLMAALMSHSAPTEDQLGFRRGINDQAIDVVVQGDGKIVVLVGRAAGANSDFMLARYNSDGSIDAGFGGGMPVSTDFFGGDDSPAGLALQTDGKIVATGAAEGGIGDFDFALARYDNDGSPDATFGIGGKVTTDFLGGIDVARSVVVQGDGKIIAGGLANEEFGDGYFALARYNGDGAPDASFGIGGKVITDFSVVVDGISDVALACDGKIVVAGTVNGFATGDAGVVRHNNDGAWMPALLMAAQSLPTL